MRFRVIAARCILVGLVLLAACSRVTQENFAKIEDGMPEQQVLAILGQATESSNVTVLGLSSTASKWITDSAVISVKFVNGKVITKSFDKPPAKDK